MTDYNYPHFESPFIQGVYNWQTLIGAVAALIGAWLLWRQINLSDRHEAERQRRRRVAARATLPLLLSGICSFAREVATVLRDAHGPAGQHAFGAPNLVTSVPELSAELPAALERFIESTDVDFLATKIADLLGDLQVLQSRVLELPRLSPSMTALQPMIEDYMIQAATVYASASSLFDYARRRVDDSRHGETMTLFSALNLLEIRDHEFPRVHETATRRAARQSEQGVEA